MTELDNLSKSETPNLATVLFTVWPVQDLIVKRKRESVPKKLPIAAIH